MDRNKVCLNKLPGSRLGIATEKRGNVAIIFALTAVVITMFFTSAIDLSSLSAAKASLQAAADAGALAAKREQSQKYNYSLPESQRLGAIKGVKTFLASAPNATSGVTGAAAGVTWDSDGAARLTAKANFRPYFAFLTAGRSFVIQATSVASSGTEKKIEIVLVLDTTASMFEKDGRSSTRFSQMRAAAKIFVNTLFNTVSVPNALRVAVVPWTTTVNIKSEVPKDWSASVATVRTPADRGSQLLPSATIDRVNTISQSADQMASQFAPVGWRGCISGNGESQSTDDSPKPGMSWDALAVPPEVITATRTLGQSRTNRCSRWVGCIPAVGTGGGIGGGTGAGAPSTGGSTGGDGPGGTIPPAPPPPPKMQGFLDGFKLKSREFAYATPILAQVQPSTCFREYYDCLANVCTASSPKLTRLQCSQNSNYGTRNAFFNFSRTSECVYGGCALDIAPISAVGCTADPNEIAWNASGGAWCSWVSRTSWTSLVPVAGPNLNCPMPMLGLSGNRSQLIDTIDRLSPAPGGTHADVGLRWGLRTLSPKEEWTGFFKQKPAADFGTNQTSKVMILMTDGANEQAVDYPGYWGCSDTSAPGCQQSPDRVTLDQSMLSWCKAIREDYKVELYTVAINVSDTNAVNLLRTCAGDSTRAFAVDAGDLATTFAAIARETFELRLKE